MEQKQKTLSIDPEARKDVADVRVEIASGLSRLDAHLIECQNKYDDQKLARAEIKKSVSRIHERLDEFIALMNSRSNKQMWAVIVLVCTVLLNILVVIIMKN